MRALSSISAATLALYVNLLSLRVILHRILWRACQGPRNRGDKPTAIGRYIERQS